VFSSAFNNISVISRWSVLLVDETGESHWTAESYRKTSSHNAVNATFNNISAIS